MGILDRLRRKGKKEEKETYYLQYQPAGQKGWVPVERFAFPIEVKDAMQYMNDAGVYNLQKRVGGMIAGYAWDKPYVVKGEAEEGVTVERDTSRVHSDAVAKAIEDDMVRAVRWFKLPQMIQSSIKQAFGGEVPFGEGGSSGGSKSLKEQLTEMRKEYDDLGSIFGSVTDTQTKKIPVKGEIPAWLVYMPDITDQMMENVEKRLGKWGLIGEEVPKRKMLEMPEKPVKTKMLDLESLKGKEEKKGGKEPGKGQ